MINCSQSLFVHSKLMTVSGGEKKSLYNIQKAFQVVSLPHQLVTVFFFFPLVWNATSHHCSLEIKHQFIKIPPRWRKQKCIQKDSRLGLHLYLICHRCNSVVNAGGGTKASAAREKTTRFQKQELLVLQTLKSSFKVWNAAYLPGALVLSCLLSSLPVENRIITLCFIHLSFVEKTPRFQIVILYLILLPSYVTALLERRKQKEKNH